jgi:hypothetical protein
LTLGFVYGENVGAGLALPHWATLGLPLLEGLQPEFYMSSRTLCERRRFGLEGLSLVLTGGSHRKVKMLEQPATVVILQHGA